MEIAEISAQREEAMKAAADQEASKDICRQLFTQLAETVRTAPDRKTWIRSRFAPLQRSQTSVRRSIPDEEKSAGLIVAEVRGIFPKNVREVTDLSEPVEIIITCPEDSVYFYQLTKEGSCYRGILGYHPNQGPFGKMMRFDIGMGSGYKNSSISLARAKALRDKLIQPFMQTVTQPTMSRGEPSHGGGAVVFSPGSA